MFAKNFYSLEFLKFLLVGGTAAFINFLGGLIFRQYFINVWHGYEVSIAIGFSLGTIVSFIFNRNFTFQAFNERVLIQFIKFIIVALFSILLASIIGHFVLKIMKIIKIGDALYVNIENAAHVITIAVMTFYNFFAMKYFAFKKI